MLSMKVRFTGQKVVVWASLSEGPRTSPMHFEMEGLAYDKRGPRLF